MRILIATVTCGGGHLAAASALEQAWRALRPKDVVECKDVLDFAPRLYRKMYVKGYVKFVEHAPELYGMFFKKTDNASKVRRATSARRRFAHHTNKKFVTYLKSFKPDVVLCPHFLPLEILGHQRGKAAKGKKAAASSLNVCIVTDFEAHAFWLEPGVDMYCVAAPETAASLVARGADEKNVVVTGIPIGAKFAEPVDVLGVRRRYGLRDDLPTLLVLSGGFGMGPVAEILDELDKVEAHFQTMVVCGRNEELRKELAGQDRKHPTHVLGFCNNMHELMCASSLIVTKPGGLTTSEAMAIGRPLVILNPIPGQETANSDFLLERGAAIKLNRVEDLPFRIKELLSSKKLLQMSAAAAALGKPNAAKDICAAVVSRVG
jgi:processive 1,2-diacylglycerol beta-glucosyltransferase